MAKQNKGLAIYQSFMKRAKRNGLTWKQAKAAWKRVRAAELKKAHRKPRKGKATAPRSTGAKYRAKRLTRESEMASFEKMTARLARREKAKARLARIKHGQAERPRRERYAAAKKEAAQYGYSNFPSYESWTGRDPSGKRKKKGSKKKAAASKKRKISGWNRFVAKHRRAGLSMKAIARLWRKEGKAATKRPKKATAKSTKKKTSKRDPGWWKHPRLHGKAAKKGWRRHKRSGF